MEGKCAGSCLILKHNEADRAFFERVQKGFHAIAAAEPKRVRTIDATRSVEATSAEIWKVVASLVKA